MDLPPGRRLRGAALLAALTAALLAGLATAAGGQASDQPTVATTEVDGPITPVIADHLRDTVDAAERGGHEALVVLLDTPGGLLSSMREIVQTFLQAQVPVIVYVSPRGADAGSAGTFVTLAAHVAAMAPATTIGAATPVDLEGGEVGDKAVNNAAAYARTIAEERGRDVEFAVASVREGRSVTAEEALDVGAIDLVVDDLDALLEAADGRGVTLADDEEVTLDTAGASVEALDLSAVRRLLQRLADPNLAFIFISVGTLALLYEFVNPGVGAGGIVGAVLLILAFFSLSVLPVNLAGAALLVLALGLFIGEIFVPGIGVLAAGGVVALVLGGLFLFQQPTGIGIDLTVLLPTAVVAGLLAAFMTRMAARTRHIRAQGGADTLAGRQLTVEQAQGGRGRARIDGTWWRLSAADGGSLTEGEAVRVTGSEGIDLVVERRDDASPEPGPEDTSTETSTDKEDT